MVSLGDALTGVCEMGAFREKFRKAFRKHSEDFKSIRTNLIHLWREEFLSEEMLDLRATLPDVVEVEVPIVNDEVTGFCYRADQLLRDHCEKGGRTNAENVEELKVVLRRLESDSLPMEELAAKIKDYGITAPHTQNALSDAYFMPTKLNYSIAKFEKAHTTYIGPNKGRLFHGFFHSEGVLGLPFAIAHYGSWYKEKFKVGKRGRNGEKKLMMIETSIAEIHHYVDPKDKSHPQFSTVEDLQLHMSSFEDQLQYEFGQEIELGQALSKGSVNNEIIGYYIGTVFLFLTRVGIDKDRLRFRQRVGNEKGQNAADCWAAEVECSFGWVECVTITERSAYDSQAQAAKIGVSLVVRDRFAELREVEKVLIEPNEVVLGGFEGSKKMVVEALLAMGQDEALKMMTTFESEGWAELCVRPVGRRVGIEKSMVKIVRSFTQNHGNISPSVIEFSSSIEHIAHLICEHSFCTRYFEDKERNLFRFHPGIAPSQCAVFCRKRAVKVRLVVDEITESLKAAGIACARAVEGQTLEDQYGYCDGLGVPLAIFVESDNKLNIRDRDSTQQALVSVEAVVAFVDDLIHGRTWYETRARYERAG